MRVCPYNIRYGLGNDGRVDLERIAREVGDADLVCLQEIEQHFPETGDVDQVAEIAALFPTHHWVFGAGVDLDADYHDDLGVLRHRRRRFGNVILSRSPILTTSTHLLPKHDHVEQLSLQRCALEAVIEVPSGPLRILTTHLAHASPYERRDQIAVVLGIIGTVDGGGVWSGTRLPRHWAEVGPPPIRPHRTLLMGDLNVTPGSAEYELLAGPVDQAHGRLTTRHHLVDAWVSSNSGPFDQPSCIEEARGDRPRRQVRLDYVFVTTDLVSAVTSMSIDTTAEGSDHQPVFADIDV
jgi:endonuclease/exonuclease/phosphatase family metal-dependent hydrolase